MRNKLRFKFALVRASNCNLVKQITLQAVLRAPKVFSGNMRPQKSPQF
jgi:hypothetical protein